jgi:hypothetical protein
MSNVEGVPRPNEIRQRGGLVRIVPVFGWILDGRIQPIGAVGDGVVEKLPMDLVGFSKFV